MQYNFQRDADYCLVPGVRLSRIDDHVTRMWFCDIIGTKCAPPPGTMLASYGGAVPLYNNEFFLHWTESYDLVYDNKHYLLSPEHSMRLTQLL